MNHPKIIVYKGEVFKKQKLPYYFCKKSKFEKWLHRAIWRRHNKNATIPKGFLVHHKNFKCWDNRPENLELLDKATHSGIHLKESWRNPKSRKRLMDTLPKRLSEAAKWHKSKEGFRWHVQNGKNAWRKGAKKKTFFCIVCRNNFTTVCMQKNSNFCSTKCYSRFKTKKSLTIKSNCRVCGKPFLASTIRAAKHCSRSCTAFTIARIKLTKKLNGGKLP